MKIDNNSVENISWQDIQKYLQKDPYKEFVKQIPSSVLKMTINTKNNSKLIDSILNVLKEREPQNATKAYSQKIADNMQALAQNIITERKQTALQKEARELLKEMKVVDLLSRYGEVTIVGSLATNLMTWPDIDIEVTTEKLPDRAIIGKLAAQLFLYPENERMVLLDNTNGFNTHYKSGVHVMFEQKKWKVDIWFFLPTEKMTGRDYMEWLNENMTEEKRKSILAIKQQVASHPKYRKEIFSTDIYEAVIKSGVKDLEEFKKYLEETNRSL